MENELLELIKKIQLERRLFSFDEAATKQGVILRILSKLGWDPFNTDEIHPEYSVAGKKVDYALRYGENNKVFIEVKKVREDLENHQEQLLNYSFEVGVKLAILSNGISWWFYLPLHEGSWEQRKFYTIEIYDQDAEEITRKFVDLVSKESVISGKAIENAEKIYTGKQKQYLIEKTLPKAWNKLINETDESLIELIAEVTEKLCGYKPDHDTVEKFLGSYVQEMEKMVIAGSKEEKSRKKPSFVKNAFKGGERYGGKKILSFTFRGTRYEVRSWKEMLIQTCNIMLTAHRDRFEEVLNLVGRKRPYFTKNSNELRSPEIINGTDIYIEVNLGADSIAKLSRDIISLFGYTRDDLSVETR